MASHVRAPWIVGTVRYRCTMAWLTPYTDIQVKYVPMVTPNTVCRSAGSGFMLHGGCRAHVAAPKTYPRTHIGLRCLLWPTLSGLLRNECAIAERSTRSTQLQRMLSFVHSIFIRVLDVAFTFRFPLTHFVWPRALVKMHYNFLNHSVNLPFVA